MVKRYGRRLVLAAAVACSAICGVTAPQVVWAQPWVESQSAGVVKDLKASLPRQAVQNEPVKIPIEYVVHSDQMAGPGKATVIYHNVDTGQDFAKTVEAPLKPGKQKAEAVWGTDETLPHGMYVVKVTLADATGKELASYATKPESVQTLIMVGGATRMLNADVVKESVKDFAKWWAELDELEAKARSAGADTSRPHLLCVILQQAEFWSKEQVGLKLWSILDINHGYLQGQVAETKKELEAMAKDPSAFPKHRDVPRPKERLTIRDGGFYAGDTQVYLNGPCFFNFTVGYMPVARELGFNVIGVSTGPSSIFPTSDEPTGTARIIDYGGNTKTGVLIDVLNKASELGIKVDLGLTSHFMPNWFYQKYPDARNNFCLYNMMPYDIEHPEALKLVEKFFANVMPQIAGHPALNSVWLANEPEYMNPNERNMAIFRPWLQGKYKTIDNLNKTWGTKLRSFDDIVASGRKGNPVPDAASTDAARLDWWHYSTERVMRHYEWQKQLVRKYDPKLPIALKLYNGTFNPEFKPMSRIDEETAFDFVDFLGVSGGSFPFSKPYKDFLRSLDEDKPLANLEYKFGWQRAKLDFWQETMQGTTDNNWWCWHPKSAFSPVPSYSRALHQAALARMDIQRLLPQIRAFNKLPRAPMAFLYPDPVAPRYWEYFAFNDPVNRALTEMGFACDYASEKRVANGRLDEYQVLIMPAANFIRDETYTRVKGFIEGGKTAIVLGAIPDQNEYSQPRDASFFKAQGQVKELPCGELKAIRFKAGKGTIYHLPEVPRSADGKRRLTEESAKLIRQFLELALRESVPSQPVTIRNEKGLAFIEYRTAAYTNAAGEKTYLTYVANEWLDSDQVIEPKLNFGLKRCRDLISGKTLDAKRIPIPPADVMLLEFVVQQ